MKRHNKVITWTLAFVLAISSVTMVGFTKPTDSNAAVSHGLSNPRTEEISTEQSASETVTTWDCVWFGRYPQNDNSGLTNEPIKWRVLSVNGDDALLLADMNLDSQPYNTFDQNTEVTWEDCTLRVWLNEAFYNTAFTGNEKNAIKTTTVTNHSMWNSHQDYNNTQDKVFLLSNEEIFGSSYGLVNSKTRQARNTSYAAEKGAVASSEPATNGNGKWITRTPSYDSVIAVHPRLDYVDASGNKGNNSVHINSDGFAIRPALHIDLTSSAWKTAGAVCSNDEYVGSTSSSGFTLGRDNNSYRHHFAEGAGFEGMKKHQISKSFKGKLFNNATKAEKNYIQTLLDKEDLDKDGEEDQKWNGSCYGIVATMGLVFQGTISLSDIDSFKPTAPSFYKLKRPCENKKLLDVIEYYYLSQFVKKAEKKIKLVKSDENNDLTNSLTVFQQDPTAFFPKLLESLENNKTLLLGARYETEDGKEEGHALLITGYTHDDSKHQHVLDIYDVNDYLKNDFYKMTIDDDYESFVLETALQTIDTESYRQLYYVEWDTMIDLDGNSFVSDDFPGDEITIKKDNNFKLTAPGGKYFACTAGKLSGDLYIQDIIPLISDAADYIISTDIYGDYGAYELTNISDGISMTISTKKGIVSLEGKGIESASINPGGDIVLRGNDYSFKVYASTDHDIVENERGLMAFEGKAKDEVNLVVNDDTITIFSNKEPITDLSVTKLVETETTTVHYQEPIYVLTEDDQLSAEKNDSHNHKFSGWKVIRKATEVSVGKKQRVCSTCGKTESAIISILNPTLKAVKIKKPKASKKSAIIKWKKVSKANRKKTKKIQIQCSTDPSFQTGVKTKYAKSKKKSLKIKGLKSKTRYYIRVRAYTKTSGAVHVSKWSNVKTVKTK